MTVLRKRPARYVAVANSTIRDTRLSFRARGVLAYLLSQPDDWNVSADRIAAAGTEGREAVRTALRELRAAGYCRTFTVAVGKSGIRTVTEVSSEPVEDWLASPSFDPPPPESSATENPSPVVRPTTKDQVRKKKRLTTKNLSTGPRVQKQPADDGTDPPPVTELSKPKDAVTDTLTPASGGAPPHIPRRSKTTPLPPMTECEAAVTKREPPQEGLFAVETPEPTLAERAKAVTDAWWESFADRPKPAGQRAYPNAQVCIKAVIKAGWPDDRVLAAAIACKRSFSTAQLETQLERLSGESSRVSVFAPRRGPESLTYANFENIPFEKYSEPL